MGNKFVNKQHNNNKQKVNEGQLKLNLFEHNNNQVEQRNGGGFWNQNVQYLGVTKYTTVANICAVGILRISAR